MDDVKEFFKETEQGFIIYVVEQRFAVGRGADYFRSFKGKDNLIDSNKIIKTRIRNILKWINKRVPNTTALIAQCFEAQSTLGLLDVISALSSLFSVESHQAAGPDVIDPIIIQEGNILPQYLNQLIHLHKESILQPVIIILLKDNDFERAEKMLSKCPNDTCIKLIRNSGESKLVRVVNKGATSVDDFLNAFSKQCFGTCSCTRRDILLNEEWASDSIIKQYAPELMKIRASLLCDEKETIRTELWQTLAQLNEHQGTNTREKTLLMAFRCIANLNCVFCNDAGNDNIITAYQLAKSVNNELLLAHVFRYAFFMPGLSLNEKIELLLTAQNTFEKNGIADHAVYCQNNRLVRQFDTENVNVRDFLRLREEAVYNVPGLVGMSHIYNNTGVAQLITGTPEDAISAFDAAIDYARSPERSVQRFAILSNKIIAKAYNLETVDEKELFRTMNLIVDNMRLDKLPFLSARYIMNIVRAGYSESETLGAELVARYPVKELVNKALRCNSLGCNQLFLQMQYLQKHYSSFNLLDKVDVPQIHVSKTGVRNQFVERYGYNPIFFSTWL